MSDHKKNPPSWWVQRMAEQARGMGPSRQLPDHTWGTRWTNDFKTREAVALHDILKFKPESLPISTVDISREGIASFNLSGIMAQHLGLGREPITIQDTSPPFKDSSVANTNGIAIWLTPDFYNSSSSDNDAEFEHVQQPAIAGLCTALSAKHHIKIHAAFIPIDEATSEAGSVLVLMSDGNGQNELLGNLRQDLLRELTKIRNASPDNPSKPTSASR